MRDARAVVSGEPVSEGTGRLMMATWASPL